jgi:enoyl-CoA hydratase
MKYLSYERLEHIGIVKFSRVDVLNALNRDLLEEFQMFLELIAKGQQLRVLILTGEGDKAFSAGADISEMQKFSHLEMLKFSELGQKIACLLQNSPFITIAAVQGYALGGGFEMALACDFIYAAENATFGLPEVHLGIIPSFGGTQRFTEALGPRLAKEYILTGKTFSAKEALDLKIVNKLFPPDSLLKNCYETAVEILKSPYNAVLQAKRAVNIASDVKQHGLEAERNMATVCFATGERENQMEAFIKQKSHHASR